MYVMVLVPPALSGLAVQNQQPEIITMNKNSKEDADTLLDRIEEEQKALENKRPWPQRGDRIMLTGLSAQTKADIATMQWMPEIVAEGGKVLKDFVYALRGW
jgi:hypothetical protein